LSGREQVVYNLRPVGKQPSIIFHLVTLCEMCLTRHWLYKHLLRGLLLGKENVAFKGM